jgi:antirestriction protein
MTETTEEDTTPRVWAGCLACYNGGALVGAWMDATDADELGASVAAMLAGPGHERNYAGEVHEEHGWFDHDNFAGYWVGEYASFEEVAAVGAAIEAHGRAFAVWFGDESGLDPADFETFYGGHFDSPEAWAEDQWDGLGVEDELERWKARNLPPATRYGDAFAYALTFDAAKYAHECQVAGRVRFARAGEPEYGVFVFYSDPLG